MIYKKARTVPDKQDHKSIRYIQKQESDNRVVRSNCTPVFGGLDFT